MSVLWEVLTSPWQACLEQAWSAYCLGSLPIGSVVVDANNLILSRGCNRSNHPRKPDGYVNASRLAHAELNALVMLPEDGAERHSWALYTTTEPCPLCLGALYMSGVRRLYYASRDPYAGSVNLLGATPYMSRKPFQVHGPPREDLEAVIVAASVDAMLRRRILNNQVVLEQMRQALPEAVCFGEVLFAREVLPGLQARAMTARDVYNNLAELWQEHIQ